MCPMKTLSKRDGPSLTDTRSWSQLIVAFQVVFPSEIHRWSQSSTRTTMWRRWYSRPRICLGIAYRPSESCRQILQATAETMRLEHTTVQWIRTVMQWSELCPWALDWIVQKTDWTRVLQKVVQRLWNGQDIFERPSSDWGILETTQRLWARILSCHVG